MNPEVLIGFLILIAGVMTPPAGGQSNAATREVTYCQVAKDPSAYRGMRIRIRGIYRFATGVEFSILQQPECCPDSKLKEVPVTIDGNPEYPDRHSDRLVKKLSKKSSGIALVEFVGDFDGRNLYVYKVERIEHLSPLPDRGPDPSWAPRNCRTLTAH